MALMAMTWLALGPTAPGARAGGDTTTALGVAGAAHALAVSPHSPLALATTNVNLHANAWAGGAFAFGLAMGDRTGASTGIATSGGPSAAGTVSAHIPGMSASVGAGVVVRP